MSLQRTMQNMIGNTATRPMCYRDSERESATSAAGNQVRADHHPLEPKLRTFPSGGTGLRSSSSSEARHSSNQGVSWILAWERGARGEEIRSLPAWVTTVSLNLARSQMRRWRCERRARDRLVPLEHAEPDAPAASGDAFAVREALRSLPRRQREVTALRYYLGLDVAAIAARLGISTGTVKSLLFRARQSLADALADTDPTEEEQ
jgi:RNA polymerase sigma factor (sigma-70 family)